MTLFRLSFLTLLLLAVAPAHAQLPVGDGKSGQPFTIDADDSLEYRQAERLYVAKGRAKVTRDGASVTADTLTAYERDKVSDADGNKVKSSKSTSPVAGGGNSEIWKFEAEGHVVIDNGNAEKPSVAYGDHATYDIDSQRAVLTGSNLHLDSGADRITARDSFEYLTDKKEAIANGNAKAVQNPTAESPATRTVVADIMHVFFTQGEGDVKSSGMTADHIEARGHVRVTTETQDGAQKQTSTATSDAANFDNKGNTATLIGNVKIARGPNQLEGERAEVDMKTGVSRLLSAPVAEGKPKPRVRGLLVPGSGVVTAPANSSAETAKP